MGLLWGQWRCLTAMCGVTNWWGQPLSCRFLVFDGWLWCWSVLGAARVCLHGGLFVWAEECVASDVCVVVCRGERRARA